MDRFLLIDDDANKGWAKVLNAVLLKEIDKEIEFEAALNKVEAEKFLKSEWNIIFLDLRFGESDYTNISPDKLSGANILKDLIRNKDSVNFATPVIVFTASRKIWNIDKMIDLGADSYFIKESPYDRPDDSFSKTNYTRLVKVIIEFLEVGKTRQHFWDRTKQIIQASQTSITNPNIRQRIEEKLFIGYAFLSGTNRAFELKNFMFAKEAFAFIVYFSLFEEISKECYEKNWGDINDIEWKIKGTNTYLVKKVNEFDDIIEVGIKWTGETYEKAVPLRRYDFINEEFEYKKWSDNRLSIREQIIGLLILKYKHPKGKILQFEELNKKRNMLDFIHSSPEAIMNETFKKNYDPSTAFEDCKNMFHFIYDILVIKA